MNIGIRLHDLEGVGLREKLQQAHELGFTCVHLALSKVEKDFVMAEAPNLLTEAYAREVRELFAHYGLQVAVLGCYLNLATPDLEALKQTMACYQAHLRFGAWIGAKVVGTETGAPNTAYQTTAECFTEEALELFIQRVMPVAAFAEEVGIPLAIEPVCRHIVHTPEKAKAVLDAVASPFVQIIFDPVNLLSEENADRQERIFEEALTLLGKDIQVVHWKDYRCDGEIFRTLAAGFGEMRGESVLRFLASHPEMPITLEDTSPDNVRGARAHLAAGLQALRP